MPQLVSQSGTLIQGSDTRNFREKRGISEEEDAHREERVQREFLSSEN
jgi:hypothetical protein